MVNIGNDWDELLRDEFEKDYYRELRSFLIKEYREETVYPAADEIFYALKLTPYKDVRAVILGQDPYHEPGQAHGLAFSVRRGTKYPPSLVNIFKELEEDVSCAAAKDTASGKGEPGDECKNAEESRNAEEAKSGGVLVPWAERGVLLLNTVLTVRAHQAGSHRGRGWEQFTDKVIELLSARKKPMVFILWGANAISKKELILETSRKAGVRHLIITAPHPSPLSAYRGFFGGRYFSRTNYFLEDNGMEPIDWSL
ncbi:MAG: uracil-DNA glycosylase [Clostridiales bacterium]|nr:uracil-DNA glycosylase [Candidatus Crickella caballi]